MNYTNAREMRLLADGSMQRIIADNKKRLIEAIREEATRGQTSILLWNPKAPLAEYMSCKCRFFYSDYTYGQYLVSLGFCVDRSKEESYVKVSWENA